MSPTRSLKSAFLNARYCASDRLKGRIELLPPVAQALYQLRTLSMQLRTQSFSNSSGDIEPTGKHFFIAEGNSGAPLLLKNSKIFTSCRDAKTIIANNKILLYSYTRKSGCSLRHFLPISLGQYRGQQEFLTLRYRPKVVSKCEMSFFNKNVCGRENSRPKRSNRLKVYVPYLAALTLPDHKRGIYIMELL